MSIGRIAILVLACGLLMLFGRGVAFYVIDPDVEVGAAAAQPGAVGGGWTLEVEPNFIINYIRSIRVSQDGTELAMREGSFTGPQKIVLPPTTRVGVVTVECDVQYDRFVAAGTTVRHQIELK